MSTTVCSGCGAPLQTEFPDQPGYVPVSALAREQAVCRRCFRITHYGEFSHSVVPPQEYERQLGTIVSHPGTVMYVLDVFDIPASLVSGLERFVQSSRVVLVVNKVDLLPVDVNYLYLTKWIEQTIRHTGVNPADVVFVSAKSDIGIELLMDSVTVPGTDRVYVVGMANVGKSSILNRWLQHAGSGKQPVFTVSKVPGTTLGLSAVDVTQPTGGTVSVVDTPGLIREGGITHFLCPDCLQSVVPSSRLRPRVYQLNPGQTLFFGNAARLDFVAGVRQGVVCYVSNDLVIHRTKLENAQSFQDLHQEDILRVPCAGCRQSLPWGAPTDVATASQTPQSSRQLRSVRSSQTARQSPRQESKVLMVPRSGCDVTLPGLGWIALSGRPFTGKLWLPSSMSPSTRPRLIGSLNRPASKGYRA